MKLLEEQKEFIEKAVELVSTGMAKKLEHECRNAEGHFLRTAVYLVPGQGLIRADIKTPRDWDTGEEVSEG
jgi:hypothetical protein